MKKEYLKYLVTCTFCLLTTFFMTLPTYADIIYNWSGSGAEGSFSLIDSAWDNEVITEEGLIGFDFTINPTWQTADVTAFSLNAGGLGTISATNISGDTLSILLTDIGPTTMLVANLEWMYVGATTYNTVQGGSFTQELASVPEPATLTLLGICIVGLVGTSARRKLKKKAVERS